MRIKIGLYDRSGDEFVGFVSGAAIAVEEG